MATPDAFLYPVVLNRKNASRHHDTLSVARPLNLQGQLKARLAQAFTGGNIADDNDDDDEQNRDDLNSTQQHRERPPLLINAKSSVVPTFELWQR